MAEPFSSSFAGRRAHAHCLARLDLLVPLGTAFGLVLLAAEHGGYYPTTWNWTALVAAGVGAIALSLRPSIELSSLELVTLGALFAFVCWVALSALWTDSIPSTVREVQRDVLYPAAFLAGAAVFRRRTARPLLGAICLAITVVAWYALATRIFPERVNSFDPVSVYRLDRPLGYWNALGALCAIGILLAIAFAARGRLLATRVAAAASLVVLASTLYFTYSRGAWLALAIGLLTAIALDRRRLQLITSILVVAPAPVLGVLIASRLHGLTRVGSTLPHATSDGHRFALAVGLLMILGAILCWALDIVSRRTKFSAETRRVYVAALVAAVLACLVVVFAHYGSPQTIVRHAWHSFTSNAAESKNLNERLSSFSSNGRTTEWHHAWRDYRAHPLLGSGAGTYEIWYLRHRTGDLKVRDAHSLYIEVLAELGPIGLALLLLAFLTPLLAAIRARRQPLIALATGAYVTFLVHAGVDWDWEMSAVTVTGILCGLSLLIAARREVELRPLVASRYGLATIAVGVALFSMVGLLGNVPAARAGKAIRASQWKQARAEASKVIRWAPWSADGWRRLGQSEVGSNQLVEARRHLRLAVRQDPNNWDRWFDLALATRGQAQRRALEKALTLNPRSPEVAEFIAGIGLKGIRVPRSGGG